jgi:hypothetical protein
MDRVKRTVKAHEVRIHDRLDPAQKVRVGAIRRRNGKILAKTVHLGARSTSMSTWGEDDDVMIWR